MTWLPYLIISAFTWAAHTACLKVLGDKLSPALVTFSFYTVALATTAVLLVSQKISVPSPSIFANKTIFVALVCAGVTIALTDYFFMRGFFVGAPMSLYAPLFSTLGLALISLIGVLFFSETLTLSKMIGFGFAAVGFFLMVR